MLSGYKNKQLQKPRLTPFMCSAQLEETAVPVDSRAPAWRGHPAHLGIRRALCRGNGELLAQRPREEVSLQQRWDHEQLPGGMVAPEVGCGEQRQNGSETHVEQWAPAGAVWLLVWGGELDPRSGPLSFYILASRKCSSPSGIHPDTLAASK